MIVMLIVLIVLSITLILITCATFEEIEEIKNRVDWTMVFDYGRGYADGHYAGRKHGRTECKECAFKDEEEWNMPCAACLKVCDKVEPSEEE